jgi:tetratricopeptide (TPR) repeat protein
LVILGLVASLVATLAGPPQSLADPERLSAEEIKYIDDHWDLAKTKFKMTDLDLAMVKMIGSLTRPVSASDWQKIKQSADAAYKEEHYQKSLKLYNYFAMFIEEGKIPEEKGEAELAIKALNALAQIDFAEGLYPDAQLKLAKAVEIAKKKNLVTVSTLATLNLLGDMKRYQLRPADCQKYYSEVLALASTANFDAKPAVADALDGQARMSFYQVHQKEAQEQAAKSFTLRRELFGEESLESASSMLTLARLKDRANAAGAQQLRLRALAMQIKLLGKCNNPTVASTLLGLASTPFDQPWSEAEHLCLAARHAVDGTLDSDSPFFTECLLSEANIYQHEYKLKPAIDAYKLALQNQTRLYGADGLAVAETMQNLALTTELDAIERLQSLKDTGNADKALKVHCPEAESLIKEAIVIADQNLGSGSVQAASMCGTYCWIKSLAGDYSESEAIGKKALEVLERCYGPTDASVGDVRLSLFCD